MINSILFICSSGGYRDKNIRKKKDVKYRGGSLYEKKIAFMSYTLLLIQKDLVR